MVEESSNVVDEEWIKRFCDLFLVGEIKGTFVRYPSRMSIPARIHGCRGSLPNTFEVHRSNFYDVSSLFTLENTITAPSRHACDIQEFRPVDHMVIC